MSRQFLVTNLLFISIYLVITSSVGAKAIRSDDSFSILLCKSSDAGAPPDFDRYVRLLQQLGNGGLADYWWDTSYGTYDMSASDVRGWFMVAKTTEDWKQGGTWDKITACIDAARQDTTHPYEVPAGRRVIVVSFPWIGVQAVGNRALVPHDANVGVIAHEAGHALGLNHSYSNDVEYTNAWWAERGEYDDPWDPLSWANSWMVDTPFGAAPVWIAGPTLDELGWLPRSRIITVGADGRRSGTYTLTALSHPEVGGPLLLRIPFDINDSNHYYTLEFRRQDRWDQGIPNDAVLIHEVTKMFTPSGAYKGYVARLLRDRTDSEKTPLDVLVMDGLIVKVKKLDLTSNKADIAIVTDFPISCRKGFVWREITSLDLVCISPEDRKLVRAENTAHIGNREPNGGRFGIETCKSGFVWRDAILPNTWADYEGDRICVSPLARQREQQNNARTAERTNPASMTFGPNACKTGYVWREADEWDWVCVTRGTRDRTLQENNLASSRRNPAGGPYGSDTCRQGFVWREAFRGDRVCVPFTSKQAALYDNAHRIERWVDR